MIKVYSNGLEFCEENKEYLAKNPDSSVFFVKNSKAMIATNKEEFILKAYNDSSILLVLLKSPFPMLVLGDETLADELSSFLINNNYLIKDFMGPTNIGDALLESLNNKGYNFYNAIRMDFMRNKERHAPSNPIVEDATINDLDEIYQMMCDFVIDCGLNDVVEKDKIKESITNYRVIRKDNQIVAMAKPRYSNPNDTQISCVYTKPNYRGHKYAQIIVNNICNEFFDKGLCPTLNVDQKNPISNHIYASIGFKKVFTQGIYYKK